MPRIAVVGWDDRSPQVLDALERAAGLVPVAVGDRRGAALVRARQATGLPCYQHLLEMLRNTACDTALIGATSGAAQVAQTAAARGMSLLVIGATADGATLLQAAESALHHAVPLAVIRPRLQEAGLAFLCTLAAGESGWRPRYLELTLAGAGGVPALLRDAVAIAGRLFPDLPVQVLASFLGNDAAETVAAAAALRYPDGRLGSVQVRAGVEERVTLFADCALGMVELTSIGVETTLTMTASDGHRETTHLTSGDTIALESARVRAVLDGERAEALLVPRDGVVLQAIEEALESGAVATVVDRAPRANLHLVRGGGTPAGPPRGDLRLVGS